MNPAMPLSTLPQQRGGGSSSIAARAVRAVPTCGVSGRGGGVPPQCDRTDVAPTLHTATSYVSQYERTITQTTPLGGVSTMNSNARASGGGGSADSAGGGGGGDVGELSVEITNVVCNFRLPMHIDLRKLAYAWSNVMMMSNYLEKKMRTPACTAKIFNNGKVVIMGCRSEEECMLVSRGIGRTIQRVQGKLNESVRMRNYRISNILANTKVPFLVNLTKLASERRTECRYEPEISTSADFKYTDLNVTVRVFHTGAIVLLGATSKDKISEALTRVYPHLLTARSCAVKYESSYQYSSSSSTTISRQSSSGRRTTRKRTRAMRSQHESEGRFDGNFSDEDDLYADEGEI